LSDLEQEELLSKLSIKINDTYSIGADTRSFVLIKTEHRKPKRARMAKTELITETSNYYYHSLDLLFNRLIELTILGSEAKSLKEVKELIEQTKKEILEVLEKHETSEFLKEMGKQSLLVQTRDSEVSLAEVKKIANMRRSAKAQAKREGKNAGLTVKTNSNEVKKKGRKKK
jgi:hypothetical protein